LAQASLAMTGAPGRLERCDKDSDDVIVLVDYAHTPDALERVLRACRGLTSGRVLLVFGCGGDRDPGKRPAMGRIAAVGAELCWVTNDNPRSEDPEKIAEAIVQGVLAENGHPRVCLDRLQAIQAAVLEAQPGDVVLVAGKGHEDYQLVGNQRLAFDDRVAAQTALALRRATQLASADGEASL
jgi:UDP-N-acetylmuramoyl-L-alanyl-D-glutamate--2,6-diaminopimelate ligase